jgi:lysozyme
MRARALPRRPSSFRSLSRLAVLSALALPAGCALPSGDEPVGTTSEAVMVCASGSVVQGVDVSVYQGTINWTSVKGAGIDFAIARISDGSALDTQFTSNWSGMKSAGLVRGAYQYFEPGQDPATQATIVIDAVGKLGAGDLPVTADMETTGGQSPATIAANLQTWASAVQAGTGKAPMIYTAEGYWDGDVASSAFSANPLWVANWGVTCPTLPTGWTGWVAWQYSDSGTVAGISDTVDLDEYNGTLAQLQAFAGGGATSADGGTSGVYAAQYVSQSWPLASSAMPMTTCQTIAASITFKNTGTLPWDGNTRLATTQPRDRTSVFADSTWLSGNRLAEVTGTVPPGGTFEFKFDFHAPPTAGSYQEYFGLVEDGVAWFSDPGQGGPPDDDIEANIDVTAGSATCTVDPGVPDGGALVDAGGPAHDGGAVASDAGGHGGAGDAATTGEDGAVHGADGGIEPVASASSPSRGGGCIIGRGKGAGGAGGVGGILAIVAGLVARRRRARPPAP